MPAARVAQSTFSAAVTPQGKTPRSKGKTPHGKSLALADLRIGVAPNEPTLAEQDASSPGASNATARLAAFAGSHPLARVRAAQATRELGTRPLTVGSPHGRATLCRRLPVARPQAGRRHGRFGRFGRFGRVGLFVTVGGPTERASGHAGRRARARPYPRLCRFRLPFGRGTGAPPADEQPLCPQARPHVVGCRQRQ